MKKVFEGTQAFEAVRKAEAWCRENGYSVGAIQGHERRGILKGDYDIAKWRNLSHDDLLALNGDMDGDMRHGPVTVTIYEVKQ